ncbi:MAG: hypothetical protein RLZZ401_1616 [Pseudomonadota bacterium]|jgi:cytochrome c oxidase assembly protein subunit 15
MSHVDLSPARRLQTLVMLTLFLTFDLVLFGAFTRLTDSGLGCPDWPGCYGHASPVGAHSAIALAQSALPSGPVTHGKAWIEMLHRYLATGVGMLILSLTALSWRMRRRTPALPGLGWPLALLFMVCLQGAFGAFTVTMKLFPAIVTLHLLGGLALLGMLSALATHYHTRINRPPAVQLSTRQRVALAGTAVLLLVQVSLGAWVSTNYAVLACQDFPACQGQWWPDMDWANGFTLWRDLGMTGQGELLGFSALTAIHFAHRLMAVLALGALAALAWSWRQHPGLQRPARCLAGLAGLQLITGLSNVVLGWPMVAALLHTGGAAGLTAVLTWGWALAHPPRLRTEAL